MRIWAILAVTLAVATPALAQKAATPPPAAMPAAAADPLSQAANEAYLASYARQKGVIKRPSGLLFKILQNGFGKRPGLTDTVQVYYTGTMINGKIFDGTSPGLPASFKVNAVIPGWTEALTIMREGDHWQLVIPPNLGYGPRGAGTMIPPNQVLVFDVTLVETTPLPKKGEPGYQPDPNDPDEKQ